MNITPEDMRDLFAPQLEEAAHIARIFNHAELIDSAEMFCSFIDDANRREVLRPTIFVAIAAVFASYLNVINPQYHAEVHSDLEALAEFIRGEA